MSKINVTRSSMPSYEEYCEEIKELWDSHWLTNMGVKHNQLQADLERYLGVKHVTLYTNGHLALENALEAMDFPRGSEVITTPFTFVSTTNAIARNGLIPIFCDVNEKDYTIDVSKIEALITHKTVAIMPVHVYGNLCDVEEIDRLAKKHNLKVIYDAAHAFGITYRGESVACFGDASMFSFHATKVFNTIEGGALCYGDESLVQVLTDLRNFGLCGEELIGQNESAICGTTKLNLKVDNRNTRLLVQLDKAVVDCRRHLIHLSKLIVAQQANSHSMVVVDKGIAQVATTQHEVEDGILGDDTLIHTQALCHRACNNVAHDNLHGDVLNNTA